MRTGHRLLAAVAVLAAVTGQAADAAATLPTTDALNLTPQVRQGFAAFYNMNYAAAMQRFRAVAAEHPASPTATDYVLYDTVVEELNRLDLLDTTFYANDGFLTGKHTVHEDPAMTSTINGLVDKAIGQADAHLAHDPHDVDALFARAWARSLQAAYQALILRTFPSALRLASQAKSDDEEVLSLDPDYVDARLVVGTYQYVIGALPFGFRLIIGLAGISGSKNKGMQMLETVAGAGVLNGVDARTCMMLFLRREGKYPDAAKIAMSLAEQFPHDYLFQLELANLLKDGGHGQEAIAQYRKVIAEAQQPGMFHNAHLELAYFGLGDTLRGQRSYAQAAEAFQDAASQPMVSPELKQRCLVAAGMSEDLQGARAQAVSDYQAALAVGSDADGGALAKKYLAKPYTGK